VVNTATNQIMSRHRNLRRALDKVERLNVESAATARLCEAVPSVELSRCGYSDDRCPYPCGAPATVTDIETGCAFCANHFREVIL
jgi:hypothetical protein